MKLWKKMLLVILGIALLVAVAVSAYGYTILKDTSSIMESTYDNLGEKDTKDVFASKEPFSILLMGIDTGDSEREDPWSGRSDSIMVATVNPDKKTTTLISLERDMLTELINENNKPTHKYTKLNDAYAEGGVKMSKATIEDILDMNIDSYALINMQGLSNLVDKVGGIDVNNTLGSKISISDTEPEYTAVINPGQQHINGDQALVYARMRYQDPEGDIGRQARQREVISQLLTRLLSLDSMSRYQDILTTLKGNMKTNIKFTPSSMTKMLGYKDSLENMDTIKLQGLGETIDSVSYQVMPANNLLSVQNAFKRSLSEKPQKRLDPNVVTYERYFGQEPSDAITPIITVNEKNEDPVEYDLKRDGSKEKLTSDNTVTSSSESSDSYVSQSEYE